MMSGPDPAADMPRSGAERAEKRPQGPKVTSDTTPTTTLAFQTPCSVGQVLGRPGTRHPRGEATRTHGSGNAVRVTRSGLGHGPE